MNEPKNQQTIQYWVSQAAKKPKESERENNFEASALGSKTSSEWREKSKANQ